MIDDAEEPLFNVDKKKTETGIVSTKNLKR